MPLSQLQLSDVCMLHQGKKMCRYLRPVIDDGSHMNFIQDWFCAKKSSDKDAIDEELDKVIIGLRKRGIDPKDIDIPLGDNCSGLLPLKYLDQGI